MVEERVERRLAAILAADVVGHSRLKEADEGGKLAQLKPVNGGVELGRRGSDCRWSAS